MEMYPRFSLWFFFFFSSSHPDHCHSWGGRMAPAIPPPHVLFTPGSSYLLDALVPVPLPFLFHFLSLLLVQQSFSICFWGSLCPYLGLWVFQLSAFRSPPPEANPLRAPITSFSHHHLPQRCSSQIAPKPSPVDRFAFCFMFSLVSSYFVSFVFCFC